MECRTWCARVGGEQSIPVRMQVMQESRANLTQPAHLDRKSLRGVDSAPQRRCVGDMPMTATQNVCDRSNVNAMGTSNRAIFGTAGPG